jgi:hypothetical protein
MDPATVSAGPNSSNLFTGSVRGVAEQSLLREAGSDIEKLRQRLVENDRISAGLRSNSGALQARHELLKDEMREQKALSEQHCLERDTAQEELQVSSQALTASLATEVEATEENEILNQQVGLFLENVNSLETDARVAEQRHNDEIQALTGTLGHAQNRLELCEAYIQRVYEASGEARPQTALGYPTPWTEVVTGLIAPDSVLVVPAAVPPNARSSVTLPSGRVRVSPAAGTASGTSPPTTLEVLRSLNLRYGLFREGLIEQVALFSSALPELLQCIVSAEGLSVSTLAELRGSEGLPQSLPRGVSFDASPPPVTRNLTFRVPPAAAAGSAGAGDPASEDVEMESTEREQTQPPGSPSHSP